MKKSYLVLAAVAALFAACSSDNNDVAEKQSLADNGPVAVGFDTYVNRGTTRAGATGPIDLDKLKTDAYGFGVFAYYTNNEAYDQIFTPNFMYNQKVTFTAGSGSDPGKWTYEPVKYWPNEYSAAQADENDKISFFAYAPYASSTQTGKPDDATKGIAGFSRNTATGDPLVKYIASGNIGDQVDLLWGVCGTDNSWTAKGTSNTQGKAGLPWLNIQHPSAGGATAQNLTFNFLHSLAGLQVAVLAGADIDTPTGSASTTENTRIYIRSITFTGMTAKGTLNLNNTVANEAIWLDFAGINDMESGQSITWFDGRKDGSEGTTIASNEKVNFLNPDLIQSGKWGTTPGVRGTGKYLFGKKEGSADMAAAGTDDFVYVIPTGEKVTCTIEYDVLTKDEMLPGFLNDNATHGSVVKNVITKDIKVGTGTDEMKLANGKKYIINLYLGLKSVTFDAAVTDWAAGSTGQGGLPQNP